MAEKKIMISIDDERASKLADILGNKTAKNILSYLADKESSEVDISKNLNLPANTVNYNVKKLVDVGLIESSKSFFWSVKGKRIKKYKVSNKTIVISPKTNSNAVFGTLLIIGLTSLIIKLYSNSKNLAVNSLQAAHDKNQELGSQMNPAKIAESVSVVPNLLVEVWTWFLLGGITALTIYMLLNWRKL